MDLSTGRCTDAEDEQLDEALNDPELHEMLSVSQQQFYVRAKLASVGYWSVLDGVSNVFISAANIALLPLLTRK